MRPHTLRWAGSSSVKTGGVGRVSASSPPSACAKFALDLCQHLLDRGAGTRAVRVAGCGQQGLDGLLETIDLRQRRRQVALPIAKRERLELQTERRQRRLQLVRNVAAEGALPRDRLGQSRSCGVDRCAPFAGAGEGAERSLRSAARRARRALALSGDGGGRRHDRRGGSLRVGVATAPTPGDHRSPRSLNAAREDSPPHLLPKR